MVDDLGYSDLGCYGSEIETPTLDRIAADGLRFSQFRFSQFYNTAKCHFSRISLLSGMYPYQAGNLDLTKCVTSAEVLSEAGYFTAMTGKWHLKKNSVDFGFQHYWGHLSGAGESAIYFTTDQETKLHSGEHQTFKVKSSDTAQKFKLTLPTKKTISGLRFDPGNQPGTAKLESLTLHDGEGNVLKSWP